MQKYLIGIWEKTDDGGGGEAGWGEDFFSLKYFFWLKAFGIWRAISIIFRNHPGNVAVM